MSNDFPFVHLKHMANTRPGLDGSASQWAVATIDDFARKEKGMSNNAVLQEDLRDMLRVLGLPDGARPQSPHEVFRECIDEVKRLMAERPRNIFDRLRDARRAIEDADALLQKYYLSDTTGAAA